MERLSCDIVQDDLPEFVGDELPPDRAEALRLHVDGCTACAEALEMVRLVAGAPSVVPPAGFEARVSAAAKDALRASRATPSAASHGAEQHAGPPRSEPPRWRVPSWGLAAAAGVVLALGTPLLVQRMQTPSLPADGSDGVSADVAGQVQEFLPSAYVSDGPVVAGAPAFDALSDEALLALLEEMEG